MMTRDNNIASADWPSLLTRILHDLARIVQTELRLFQAGLEPILSNMVDRFLASMVALMAFGAGAICLLVALIMFLSRSLGWPGSFAAAGFICFIGGIASLRMAKRGAPQIAPLAHSFEDVIASAEPGSD
jgi:uncharacterized membrane protein YqjE